MALSIRDDELREQYNSTLAGRADKALILAIYHTDLLHQLLTLGGQIVASLSELQAAVAAERTVIESAVVLLNGIAERIAALELNQAAVDALAAEVKDQSADLGAAVAAVPGT